MKLLLTILLATITYLAHAQEKHFVPKEKWSEKLYIDDDFCAQYGLEPGETNNLLKAWNNLKPGAAFTRIVDIRWYFSSPEEAAKYLTENKKELSEGGDDETKGLKIPGASNLIVYHDGATMKKMSSALGLTNHMYIFLFTEKNYVVKVFVNSEKNITRNQSVAFPTEAARRLSAAIL